MLNVKYNIKEALQNKIVKWISEEKEYETQLTMQQIIEAKNPSEAIENAIEDLGREIMERNCLYMYEDSVSTEDKLKGNEDLRRKAIAYNESFCGYEGPYTDEDYYYYIQYYLICESDVMAKAITEIYKRET